MRTTSVAAMIFMLIGALSLWSPANAQSAPPTPNQIFADAGKLHTLDAIDEQMMVDIGGIKQWVRVRGRHRSNPVLLFLHGGPGFTASPTAFHFMRDWEEYFTVVQWDQRGGGKTFAANDPAKIRPTMNIAQIVSDAEELTNILRQRYRKQKIVLFGHSWGSMIGVKLAQAHPELFHVYAGSGQFVDFARSEALGYQAIMAAARADNNQKAVDELLAIAPFPDLANPQRNRRNLEVERRWLAHYDGYYFRGGFGHGEQLATMSPDHDADELKIRNQAMGFSNDALWGEVGTVDLTGATSFRLPVIILQGRHDLGTSSQLAREWFDTIEAPAKQFVWFEDSGHMVHEEEPGKMLVALVNIVRPFATGDAANRR